MFKEKIRTIREINNYTQDEFAKEIFVTRTAVSKWETGKGYPSLDTLKVISSKFEVSIDELISEEDIGSKKKIDKKDKNERIVAVVIVLLIVSLVIGGAFFRKNEILRYSADSTMRYGLRGISSNIEYTASNLDDIDVTNPDDVKRLCELCQKLDKDIFYFSEVVASNDYGIAESYDEYDCIEFYAYISTVATALSNYEQMTEAELVVVYDSLKKVCNEFNDFDWMLWPTDNYITHNFQAYNFMEDPSGVKDHLERIGELTRQEEEKFAF